MTENIGLIIKLTRHTKFEKELSASTCTQFLVENNGTDNTHKCKHHIKIMSI